MQKWSALWAKHDGAKTSKILNHIAYADETRTHDNVCTAATKILSLAQDIRADYDYWVAVFGFSTGLTVDFAWALNAAVLTEPGIYASKLNGVPVKAIPEHKHLIEHPDSGKAIRDFIVAECQHSHNVVAKPATEKKAFKPLSFDKSESEEDGNCNVDQLVAQTKQAQDALHAFQPPDEGAQLSESKINKRKAKLASLEQAFLSAFNTLGETDAGAAAQFDVKAMKQTVKRFRADIAASGN